MKLSFTLFTATTLAANVFASDTNQVASTNAAPATNAVGEASSSAAEANDRTDRERIEFLMRVASVYFDEQEYDDAVSAYERVLEINPTHQGARYTLGHMYIQAEQFSRAEEQLLALLEAYPEDFKLLNNLAWLYATADDPHVRDGEKAIEYARKAMVISPNDHHVWSTLSEAYYVTGQYEKALRAIEQMARLAARYGGGLSQTAVDDYNAQIRKCQRAVEAQKALDGASAE